MTHTGFVLFAYGATALVVAGLVLWVRLDRAAQLRALDDLGERPRDGRGGSSRP